MCFTHVVRSTCIHIPFRHSYYYNQLLSCIMIIITIAIMIYCFGVQNKSMSRTTSHDLSFGFPTTRCLLVHKELGGACRSNLAENKNWSLTAKTHGIFGWSSTKKNMGLLLDQYLVPWEPTFPSFLRLISPIFQGIKTFMFPWVWGSKGRWYN